MDYKTSSVSEYFSKDQCLEDYRVAFLSRQASLLGRKEVLTGKAKFGIFGDGKELPQIAMARAFNHGDWRSGYYRDQTFMMALGEISIHSYFAQLYADADPKREPSSMGRQMNNHFATRYISQDGDWLNQCEMYNSVADASPTASQMPRLVGLGYASKIYRNVKELSENKKFSNSGQEIGFGTIGDASTSEGIFWESLNAAGVLQIPMLMSVWDDGFGISVSKDYQTTRGSISKLLSGFQKESDDKTGMDIYTVEAWNYPKLIETYKKAAEKIRETHIPALIHVTDCTQPQGHSTSGSHERYKSAERLQWETDYDGLSRMREWLLKEMSVSESELTKIEENCTTQVTKGQKESWDQFLEPLENERKESLQIFEELDRELGGNETLQNIAEKLSKIPTIHRRDIHSSMRKALMQLKAEGHQDLTKLVDAEQNYRRQNKDLYNSFTMASEKRSPLRIEGSTLELDGSKKVDGFQIINDCFDHNMGQDPRIFVIGEDVGKLGGVNQGFKGLSEKYGEMRVTDTGIREATILGQGLGAAIRGLRPVVDIQYLDYVLYCFQTLSDDLASLHYRSAGGQIAPVIVRTKGHRLEGIWHTGSPMGMLLHGLRGMHVCVPRNMTQAAGMYNTLLEGDDPALVIEVLNGYRVKEPKPANIGEYRVALGEAEVLKEGTDITVVTYGACVRIAEEAAKEMEKLGVSIELIDCQTLLPFDRSGAISNSIAKTNAVIFFDEDVPGGASSYMMQQVLEQQGGYWSLDSQPRTLTAKEHRAAYGSDGDYYSKPNAEDLCELCSEIMYERDPAGFGYLN